MDRKVSFASKDKLEDTGMIKDLTVINKLFEIEYSHILIIMIIFYAYVLCYLIKRL